MEFCNALWCTRHGTTKPNARHGCLIIYAENVWRCSHMRFYCVLFMQNARVDAVSVCVCVFVRCAVRIAFRSIQLACHVSMPFATIQIHMLLHAAPFQLKHSYIFCWIRKCKTYSSAISSVVHCCEFWMRIKSAHLWTIFFFLLYISVCLRTKF